MFQFNLKIFYGLSWTQISDLIRFAARRLNEERLPQVAGSLTFTTVLAVVPVLTIALAIFTAFPLFNTFRASLEIYFVENLMPKTVANTILGYLNQFASKSTRLSALGAVVLVVTAIAMMSMIDRVFNQIWRVKTRRSIGQRVLVYWAAITLGPLLIAISITVTSYLFAATNGVVLTVVPFIGAVFYTTVSVFLTTAAFTLLYVAVPNRLIDWRDAAWGGAVAGIAFEIAKRLFASYIVQFPTYTMVYGTVAAFPIFLIWIYMFWMITLAGALVTAALPVVKYERWWHVPKAGSAFIDAMAVLRVLVEARAGGASVAVDAKLIRSRTRIGIDEAESLLQRMLDMGWVGRIKTDAPKYGQFGKRLVEGIDRWALLVNPDQLTLAEVYRLFVFDSSSKTAIEMHVEQAVEQGLAQSLSTYFDS